LDERQFCILVVDDEKDFRDLLRFHFEDLGYLVFEAGDGQEALDIFAERRREIDLVITDIRMPRLDGERLIQELRRRAPHLPIIGVTGHMDLQDALRMMGWGAYFYLHKPLDPWPIIERLVDNAIRFHRNQRSVERARKKEVEIARLLRTYIVETSNVETSAAASSRHLGHSIGLDIAALPIDRTRPSGDFTEWFERSPHEICFYISDSSGHDDLLPSFLACLCNMALHRAHQGGRPRLDEIVTSIDRAVCLLQQKGGLPFSKYLTFFLGQIQLEHGELDYVCAGHPAALLLRSGEAGEPPRCQRLDTTCKPVGYLFGESPTVQRTALRPGDLLFVYTDGASELLEGDDHVEAGFERLEALLKPLLALTAREIVEKVAEELTRFAGESGLQDDTTLLAIRVVEAG
jgi:serine phosphatase RsbU (regulator of sigma subunit)